MGDDETTATDTMTDEAVTGIEATAAGTTAMTTAEMTATDTTTETVGTATTTAEALPDARRAQGDAARVTTIGTTGTKRESESEAGRWRFIITCVAPPLPRLASPRSVVTPLPISAASLHLSPRPRDIVARKGPLRPLLPKSKAIASVQSRGEPSSRRAR